ncbi:MAG: MarR family transcriptional regulator [Paracoccus sp. (in: a-proteobacteria)]|nr:MarR family transcriptional regulator [Paracoccus sp. (in: a-proteobacteria)]
MTDSGEIAILSSRINLGYLTRDIAFMSRVLRAHVRWATAAGTGSPASALPDIALLGVVGLNPGISQNDLAATMVMKKSAVTKLVAEMEAAGLIRREKPKTDRRYNALRLTPEGMARWNLSKDLIAAQQDALLAPLTTRERARLFELLGRLVVHHADRLDNGEAHSP